MEKQQEWAYMHTEEYIREKEQEEKEWNKKNKAQLEHYMQQIEQKLQAGTEEAREELLVMFHNKNFIETYKTENDLAYMIVIMQIYENEKRSGEEKCILDMGNGSREIREKFQELKFSLWRMEFAKDAQAKQDLVKFVQKNQATPEMIQYIIHTSVYDKTRILLELADLFIGQNMLRYAFQMLEYAEELAPGNEEILCILAQLCICAGNVERAGKYLDQIKNPGKLTEGIREKYGC